MIRRLSKFLTSLAVTAVVSALLFVAYMAPGMPRTGWGWAISAAIGVPLLGLAHLIVALCFSICPARSNLVLRLVAVAALMGGLLWALHAFLAIPFIRAQFR